MIPESGGHWLELTVLAAPFLLIVIGFSLNLYIGHRHLDTMLEALENSRHIVIHGAGLRHQGWFGRLLLVGKISGVVLWSWPLVRIGEIEAEDIRSFPKHLKRLIRIHMAAIFSAFIWLVFF